MGGILLVAIQRAICALLLCLKITTAAEAYDLYKDPSQPLEARVQDLMKRMTLAEKIGQMTQIERTVANDSHVYEYMVGSVLNGGGSDPTPNKLKSWRDMVYGFQKQAMATRLAIPMIYGVDAVHGHNNVVGATIFPHNIGLGATRDRDLVKRIGAATALEVRATGIPYVFAPCIATCRDPRWGRCYESYSENTDLVRNMTDIILGLQGEPKNKTAGVPYLQDDTKVAACAKHYVGDGGTTDGINENNTVIDYKGLVKIHMAPYFDAIAKGVNTVMISYSSWNGIKMHANKFLITKVLKRQLGFKGFVISDWEGIDRITSPPKANYTFSVLAGISAGIDMIMVPYDTIGYISKLTMLVNRGYVKMSRIDDAVYRILKVKFSMGLFEKPYPEEKFMDQLGKAEHRELAREAVRKSLVLLKNGKTATSKPLLPLSKDAKKIIVAGSHADDIGNQCGGWTITWQGSNGTTTNGTTILKGIKAAVSKDTEIVHKFSPAKGWAAKQDADYAIVVIGEPPYAETFGDSLNLTLPSDSISTIKNVCPEVKCLVVIISGRPVVFEPYVHLVDALVAAWLPGTEGNGVADVIFGDYQFVGKLSRTWFKTVEQLPMNVGDEHYDPLFPYGFGLTY
ncbi:unnamed protein product [Calypogeia fissa]